MGVRLRRGNGYIFISVSINCGEFRIETDRKGDEHLKCIERGIKSECKDCSLISPKSKSINGV